MRTAGAVDQDGGRDVRLWAMIGERESPARCLDAGHARVSLGHWFVPQLVPEIDIALHQAGN